MSTPGGLTKCYRGFTSHWYRQPVMEIQGYALFYRIIEGSEIGGLKCTKDLIKYIHSFLLKCFSLSVKCLYWKYWSWWNTPVTIWTIWNVNLNLRLFTGVWCWRVGGLKAEGWRSPPNQTWWPTKEIPREILPRKIYKGKYCKMSCFLLLWVIWLISWKEPITCVDYSCIVQNV